MSPHPRKSDPDDEVKGTIKPLNDQREMTFEYVAPSRPFPVACDLHPWMRAWWLVLDHPYAAISDAEGKFTIADLPPGNYEFRVWHEKFGDIHQALKVAVKADQMTVLEDIRVPAASRTP
jgi:hypothetical protein